MGEVSISDVGFPEVSTSPLSAQQTGIIAAVLDGSARHADRAFGDGAVLPLPWHWAHFTPRADTSDLGEDGHPPTPQQMHAAYPRRMWAGGSFHAPGRLLVGE